MHAGELLPISCCGLWQLSDWSDFAHPLSSATPNYNTVYSLSHSFRLYIRCGIGDAFGWDRLLTLKITAKFCTLPSRRPRIGVWDTGLCNEEVGREQQNQARWGMSRVRLKELGGKVAWEVCWWFVEILKQCDVRADGRARPRFCEEYDR